MPLVKISDILQCEFVQPLNRAPNPSNSTPIYFTLTVDRLVGIDEIDMSISVMAALYLQWKVDVCTSSSTASSVSQNEMVFVTKVNDVWHPTLIFTNSTRDTFIQSEDYGNDLEILFQPTQPNRTLYFYWIRIGIFESKCDLNLEMFPFDVQQCQFTFMMKDPTVFSHFGGVKVKIPLLTRNSQWFISESGTSYEVGTVKSPYTGKNVSFTTVLMRFQRNPTYHIFNIMTPCLILVIIILGSFIVPPSEIDRTTICCTVLLAFVVAQADLLEEIPKTPQRVLMAEYMLLFTAISAIVVFYDMFMVAFNLKYQNIANKNVEIFSFQSVQMSVARAIDLTAFLLTFNLVVIIHLNIAYKVL